MENKDGKKEFRPRQNAGEKNVMVFAIKESVISLPIIILYYLKIMR